MPSLIPSPALRLQDLPPAAAHFCLAVERFCTQELGLDLNGKKILAAFSGGADSLALLLALHCLCPRLGSSLVLGHLDHGLRASSGQEAKDAEALARQLGLACIVKKTDVAALAKERGMGLEEAGRVARLDFFADARGREGCDWVALGHQLNDLAEDSLMRLMRGAGWPGLAGMAGRDDARRLFRPLLLTPRAAIDEFAMVFAVAPVVDAMNDDTAYLRNRVRTSVLPLFIAENPAFLDTVAQRWHMARLDAAYFQDCLPAAPAEVSGELLLTEATLETLPAALRLRRYKQLLDHMGPGQSLSGGLFALDRAWLARQGGKKFTFPGGKSAVIHKGDIRFFYTKYNKKLD